MNPTLSLTKDPIPSLIKKIALPASVGTFFQTMFNVVDTFFAGKNHNNPRQPLLLFQS